MSTEEHIVENIINWVQQNGWANIPEQESKEWFDLYHQICDGNYLFTTDTFGWLLEMAKYVVYQETVWGDNFAEDSNEEDI